MMLHMEWVTGWIVSFTFYLHNYIHCSLDQVTSDIAVSDFPDYVLRMTEEDEHSNSMLAQEYHVYIHMFK